MAIFVDNDTRLVVQGLTGSEGRFHGLRNRAYGTALVAGVTPGKGGQDVEGVPVLDTVAEAVEEHGANTAMVFVPAPFAADAVYEAIDAGIVRHDRIFRQAVKLAGDPDQPAPIILRLQHDDGERDVIEGLLPA